MLSKGREKEPEKKAPTQGIPKTESEMYTANLSNQPIITLLKSEQEADKLTALKILTAMQITRKDISPFVPYVVNLITAKYQTKKLAYFFLCQCSDKANNYILMSINTFHKELTDGKMLTRASALRAFSSLRIEEILHVLTLSLQRGAGDFSIYVRRSACYALVKLSEWEDCDRNLIIQLLVKLIADSNALVTGPALMAFNRICPENLDLLHGHFRRIVRMLGQFEFLFIPNVLQVLVRYSRIYLDQQFVDCSSRVNPDFKVLLEVMEPLLNYDSPSVAIAVAEAYLFFKAENYYFPSIIALLTFKYAPYQLAFLELSLLLEYAKAVPGHFSKIFSYFYVNFTDHKEIIFKKLEILGMITTEHNASLVLKELSVYAGHENAEILTFAITTIGKICEISPSLAVVCTKHLVLLLRSKSPHVTSQVIVVMRKLINQDPQKHRKIIVHCAKNIESIHFPVARACALWIIGRYYQYIPTLAAETMRKLSINFAKESALVKHQIINSTTKMYSETNTPHLEKVLYFLLELGFYDISYDIRDKCRLISSIFQNKSLAVEKLQIFWNTEEIVSVKQEVSAFVPLTLSYLTGVRVKGYERYWEELLNKEALGKSLSEDTSNLRDEEIAPVLTVKQSTHYSNQDVVNVVGTGLKARVVVNDPASLQDFLNESSEEEYEESEESEEQID